MSLRSRIDRLIPPEKRQQLGDQLQKAASTALDRQVRLAVTGLSQAGKTVFITSLLDHLLNARDSNALPFFNLCNEDRLLGVKLLPPQSWQQQFPFQQSMEQLNAEPPLWPPSTDQLSTIRLAIRYRPGSKVQRMVSETATLYVDIIDYPGEWLLDLPMLQQSFEEWSQQQYRLINQPPRLDMAGPWLESVAGLNEESPADSVRVAELSNQYRGLLQSFRNHEQRLSLLQPGRFILPGKLEGSELLQFFPLPESESAVVEGSVRELLEQRFEAYKQQVVMEFYKTHFSRFDRQVVLVDCLKTLNNGRACFDDMQEAVAGILQSFQYGPSGLLRRLFKPRIDRVLFASTKADHVTANQHHNLEQFLELIIQQARRDIQFEGLDTRCMAIASYRATEAAEAEVDGQRLSCLKGYRKQDHEPVALFPGEVPTELPQESDWTSQRFRFVDFAPRDLQRIKNTPVSHIRMDQALQYLLGDKLR